MTSSAAAAREKLEALVIDAVELHPTRYKEAVSGGVLSINAIAMVPAQVNERLRKHMKEHSSFPVVRRGISETPVTMVFGTCAWSLHPEGTKYSLILREEKIDSTAPPIRSNDIAEYRRHDMLAYRAGFSEELALLLVSKGTITEEELVRVRRRADADVGDRILSWLEVRDVDELMW